MVNLLYKDLLGKIICTTLLVVIFSSHHVEGRQKRMIFADDAKQSDFKYHVSIHKDGDYLCGGAIIDRQHVLTAAHCFFRNGTMDVNKSQLTVRTGTNRLQSGSGLEYEIEKIMLLLDFVDTWSRQNPNMMDIAVLKLKKVFHIDGFYRKVIKLPREYDTRPFEGETVTVAGYGLTEEAHIYYDENHKVQVIGTASSILKTIQTVVTDSATCAMTERHLCTLRPRNAYDERLPAECYGDSGSPLVYHDTVVGVVSAGPDICGDPKRPTIYTRVSFYLQFIRDAIKESRNNNQMVIYKKCGTRCYHRI